MWAVGALGHWALILGTRGLGNVTCILGPGRGSLLGHVAPFLVRFSQTPADGGRGVTWVGSGWVCPAALFWAKLAGRAWPRPTDFVLPRPWDSPGKNTGVGCHFLLQCMKVKRESEPLSHVRLLATQWTAAHQAPLPMGFSRQEYWSGVPLPSPLNTTGVHQFTYCKFT